MTSGAGSLEPKSAVSSGWWLRLFRRAVDVRPEELKAMLFGCGYFFLLLSSYFILRPIRDAFAVAAGVSRLPWLFAGTLSVMLVANPLFSALVARFPVRRLFGITYQFFALNLLAFYVLSRTLQGEGAVWLGRVFFVWLSVFNLFLPSTFWAFMADHFRSDQAKRLFGFIGVGGTVGSIVGSAVTALLAQLIGPNNLLVISIALLELAALIVVLFPARSQGDPASTRAAEERAAIGGKVWAGLTSVARSPYLTAIAGLVFLYVVGNTVLYFEQTDIVGRHFKSHGARTQFLARIELAAQSLTALTQAFFTGRIIRWIGLAATLAILPALSAIGFAFIGVSAVGLLPLLATYVVFAVLRRGLNFALANPGKEILFTAVSREDKFKAKSFIDTFVYRAGDQITAWTYGGLTALGLGLAPIAWAAVPVSLAFLALGIWLGRRHEELCRPG